MHFDGFRLLCRALFAHTTHPSSHECHTRDNMMELSSVNEGRWWKCECGPQSVRRAVRPHSCAVGVTLSNAIVRATFMIVIFMPCQWIMVHAEGTGETLHYGSVSEAWWTLQVQPTDRLECLGVETSHHRAATTRRVWRLTVKHCHTPNLDGIFRWIGARSRAIQAIQAISGDLRRSHEAI
eukprot:6826518-Prymnesium_polylepis.1